MPPQSQRTTEGQDSPRLWLPFGFWIEPAGHHGQIRKFADDSYAKGLRPKQWWMNLTMPPQRRSLVHWPLSRDLEGGLVESFSEDLTQVAHLSRVSR
jgi:hypothetical protein